MARPPKPRYRKDRDAWVCMYQGSLRTLARGRDAKKQAWQSLRRLLAERRLARPDSPALTLLGLYGAFLEWVQRNLAPLTYEWYRRHLSTLVRHAGPRLPAAELRPEHVTAWVDAHEWGQSTRDGAIRAAKRLTSWGRRQRLLDVDELQDLEKPGIKARDLILAPGQAEAIVAAIPDREFRELLAFLGETGCRPSEAMRLEAAHVDLGRRVAVLPGKTTRRTKRRRVIYLSERAAALLAGLMGRYPQGALFRNTRGNPWTRHATACRFADLRIRLGMGKEATAESFRHRHLTDCLLAGIPIATVAEIAGHASTAMISRHYSKLHEHAEHILEAAEEVSRRKASPG